MIVTLSVILLRKQVTSQYHIVDDRLEVSAIVSEFSQRLKRLEENLVDQKVKLEILELRAQRSSSNVVSTNGVTTSQSLEALPQVRSLQSLSKLEEIGVANPVTPKLGSSKHAGTTELEALRLVFDGRGRTTAIDIQQKIGRTREHTARMMNGMYQEGLVDRDVTVRPFSYSITQKGRDLLNS